MRGDLPSPRDPYWSQSQVGRRKHIKPSLWPTSCLEKGLSVTGPAVFEITAPARAATGAPSDTPTHSMLGPLAKPGAPAKAGKAPSLSEKSIYNTSRGFLEPSQGTHLWGQEGRP